MCEQDIGLDLDANTLYERYVSTNKENRLEGIKQA